MVPRCFFEDSEPTLFVLKPTERPYTLRKNNVIAHATKPGELPTESPITVQEVKVEQPKDDFMDKVNQMEKHSIYTGSAEPIRQRLRRTPANFTNEEEQLIAKMLEAKLIQPSFSEWDLPPVLIRKRDD